MDNVGYTPGEGASVAADDIGGNLFQRIKLTLGADGVNDGDVSAANPVPVSGAVTVSNFPAQTGLTDAQLRASAVPVSGTVTANTGLSQPLTDAQLRATAVPVSGTLSVGNFPAQTGLTNAELRAESVPVSIAGELIEAIEALRMAVQALTRSGLGQAMPDTAMRLRVVVDAITGSLTLGTVSTVSNVSTIATLTNQTQIGGNPANDQIPALMRMSADSSRRNISTS
jgi:hypothetical protein